MKRSPLFILLALAVLASVQPRVCFSQDQQSASPSVRKVVNKVVPVYPQMARAMNLTGTVKLEVLVQASGSAKSIQVRGGNPLLAQSAEVAVHAWKWDKAEHETTELVEFHFTP